MRLLSLLFVFALFWSAPSESAYRASSAQTFTFSGTSNSVNSAVGAASGDIIVIAAVSIDDVTLASSGFTVGGRIATGGSHASQWLYKVAGGSEPATYTVTADFGAGTIGVVFAISGRNTTTPITASQSTALGSPASSPISVALTGVTAASGDDVFYFGSVLHTTFGDRFANWTPPGSYTDAVAEASGNSGSFNLSYRENVSAGATGTITGTATQTTGTDTASPNGWVIAFKSAAGGGSNLLMKRRRH